MIQVALEAVLFSDNLVNMMRVRMMLLKSHFLHSARYGSYTLQVKYTGLLYSDVKFLQELVYQKFLHCVLSLAVQCIVIGPVCLQRVGGRALFVCGSVTTITQNCMH